MKEKRREEQGGYVKGNGRKIWKMRGECVCVREDCIACGLLHAVYNGPHLIKVFLVHHVNSSQTARQFLAQVRNDLSFGVFLCCGVK